MKKKAQKKEFVCEADRIMAAFAKVNLREAVAPMVRGKIVEDEDTYNKVQQLLDCPDMEHAHQFLLDVDFEDLTPETKQQIDDLYQLAVSQGYLDEQDAANEDEYADDEEDFDGEGTDVSDDDSQPQVPEASGGFEDGGIPDPAVAASKDSIGMNAPTMNSSAYTLFYSAMKNGEIKTGECYSNANTLENAKLDAIQKLQKLGFTAVDIIAAEETDTNARGCDSTQPEEFGAPLDNGSEEFQEPDPTPVPSPEEDEYEDDEEKDDEFVGEAEKDDKKDEEEPEEADDEEEEEPAEEEPKKKELSRSEKLDFFKRYLEEFKGVLQKMKAECYAEMALADRAKFYDEMNKVWDGKPDPTEFMTADNVDQIEHMKIKL